MNKHDEEYNNFVKYMGFHKPPKKNCNVNKLLLSIALSLLIILLATLIVDKIIDIKTSYALAMQTEYDLRYKETVSTYEDDYIYVYRRIDRETGKMTVVASAYDSRNGWISNIVDGDFK